MERKTSILVDHLRFPESIRWYEGKVWFSDFFRQQVMCADLNGLIEKAAELPDVPSGLGWTPDGRMLVVSAMERRLLSQEDHGFAAVADLSELVEYPCNDLVVDGQGRAYIANMGYDFGNPQAEPQPAPILLVTPEGGARIAAGGLAFPNGMGITPDGSSLIVAESHAARLTVFDVEPDGSLANRRSWAQFEDQITPDGISLDAGGGVWVASPNTREVIHVFEGAEITERIPVETIPLDCMLGGPERRTLFVATTESLDPSDTRARGRIETIPVDVPGAGLP